MIKTLIFKQHFGIVHFHFKTYGNPTPVQCTEFACAQGLTMVHLGPLSYIFRGPDYLLLPMGLKMVLLSPKNLPALQARQVLIKSACIAHLSVKI